MCTICQAMNPDLGYIFHTPAAPFMAEYGEGAIDATAVFPGLGSWTGTTITDGDTYDGTLTGDTDIDLIEIIVQAGSTWTFQMKDTDTSAGFFAPYLALYDADGGLVDVQNTWSIDGGSYTALMSYTNSSASDLTLYLSASGYTGFGGGHGSYRLSANRIFDGPYGDFSVAQIADVLIFESRSFGLSSQTYAWDVDVGDAIASNDIINVDITRLDSVGQSLATAALQAWNMVSGIVFHATTLATSGGFATNGSGIVFYDDDPASAYANTQFYPNGEIINAYVNVGTSWLYGGDGLAAQGTTIDSYAFQTYLHEIGHALGLGHGGFYNSTASYSDDAAYANDSWQMSVMSYFSQAENTNITADYAFAVTPMVADILAIQQLYGVAGNIRTANTTYGADSTAGGYYDSLDAATADLTMTIIDDGGIDTFNFSSSAADQTVDLESGTISDVFGLIGNLIINPGTIIENVIFGAGNDSLTGNAAANTITAGNGNDIVAGLDGNDVLRGGGGSDTLSGGAGADTLNAGIGNDMLHGGDDDDLIRGQGGADTVFGGNGSDTIYTGVGDDIAHGNSGHDRIFGQGNHDALFGGGGNDTLSGGSGNDNLAGGEGDDTLYGQGNDDTLDGGTGNDFLSGAEGSDILIGGSGNDTLNGSKGADRLTGGSGDDTMNGGTQADTFVFAPGFGVDRINAFEQGIDTIELDAAIWGGVSLNAQDIVATYASLNVTGTILTLDFAPGNTLEVQSGAGLILGNFHLDLAIV